MALTRGRCPVEKMRFRVRFPAMRDPVDGEKILRLLEDLGNSCRGPGSVYITGGSSAVVLGWRQATIDVDLKFFPEPEGIFESLPGLKIRQNVNIEMASPDDFVPALPGWRERSKWITTINRVDFYHFDFYTQSLSKLERDHAKDRVDVAAMVRVGLVVPTRLLELCDQLTPGEWSRYPAIEPDSVRAAVIRLIENEYA